MGFFQDVGNTFTHTASNISKGINSGLRSAESAVGSVGKGIGTAVSSVGKGLEVAFKDVGQIGMGIFKTWENMMNKGLNLLSSPMFLIVLAIGGVLVLSIALR